MLPLSSCSAIICLNVAIVQYNLCFCRGLQQCRLLSAGISVPSPPPPPFVIPPWQYVSLKVCGIERGSKEYGGIFGEPLPHTTFFKDLWIGAVIQFVGHIFRTPGFPCVEYFLQNDLFSRSIWDGYGMVWVASLF